MLALRLLLALALLLCVSTAQADVPISPRARQLFKTGVELLEDPEGPRYEEAYRAFKAAFRDSPSPRILGNIGLCAMKLERDGEAIDAYRRYLDEVKDIDPEERAQIQRDLRLLEQSQARLKLTIEPDGAVIVDERKPARGQPVTNRYGPVKGTVELGLRPGVHRIRVEHEKAGSRELTVELDAGEKREEKLVLEKGKAAPKVEPDRQAFPIPYVRRPMTLPERTLAPALGVRYGRRPTGSTDSQEIAGVDLLAADYGILDDLQIDLYPLPLEIVPQIDYGTAHTRLTYRFLEQVVELGASLELGLFRGIDERVFFLNLGVLRALAHLTDWARLDTAFELTFFFRDPALIGMNVPIEVAFQPIDYFFLGLSTGVGIYHFEQAAETVVIPLGAFAGTTVPLEERPLLDIGLRFAFNPLFVPGSDDRVVETRSYLGQLLFRLYFYL